MRAISAAQKRVRAARHRMANLVGKANLGTEDPLMAEIQMAQLDALLAMAHVALGIEAKITISVEELAIRHNWEHRLGMMEGRVRELNNTVHGLKKDTEDIKTVVKELYDSKPPPSRTVRSYWDRLLGRE